MVVELFGAGSVHADVVGAPAAPESSLRVESSPTRSCSCLSCGSRPASVRRMATAMSAACPSRGRTGARPVEERVTGEVRGRGRVGEHVGVERSPEVVGGEQVHPAVADDRGPGGDGVEDPLQAGRGGPPFGRAPPGPDQGAGAVGGPREVEQVGRALRRSSCRARAIASRTVGDTPAGRPFELGVVLDAHAGQGGDLAAAQPRDPAAADVGQAGLGGVSLARRVVRNSRTSARLSTPSTVRREPARWGCPVRTRHSRDFSSRRGQRVASMS